ILSPRISKVDKSASLPKPRRACAGNAKSEGTGIYGTRALKGGGMAFIYDSRRTGCNHRYSNRRLCVFSRSIGWPGRQRPPMPGLQWHLSQVRASLCPPFHKQKIYLAPAAETEVRRRVLSSG